MKRSSTIFLQAVIVLIGIGVFAAMLWEPNLEGRNAHATVLQVYFHDPFLAYVYLGSVPFFVGLYQVFKVLGYAGRNKLFSQAALNALRTIKYCALMTAGAIVAADAFLMIAARSSGDDPAGAVALGVVATVASFIIATAAAIFARLLKTAVDIKSETTGLHDGCECAEVGPPRG